MTRTINNIVVKEQTKYNITIDEGNSYAHIPMSIGQSKGDVIGFTGAGAPVHVPVGADGSVLVADSTESAGIRWGVVSSAGGIELENNSGALILAGSICQLDADTEGVVLADNSGDLTGKTIVIALNDVYAGEYGQFVSWDSKASVLCAAGTYSAGDQIRISTSAGIGWNGGTGMAVGKVIKDVTLDNYGTVPVLLEKPYLHTDMMMNGFKIVRYYKTGIPIGGNTNASFSFTPNEAGYKPLGAVGFQVGGTGSSHGNVQGIMLENGTFNVYLNNHHSADRSFNCYIYVLFIRNDVNVPIQSKTL